MPVVLHVAVTDEGGVADAPARMASQLENANRLFAPIGVGFAVERVELLPPGHQVIVSREDRDELGRDRTSRGRIHVFVVERLANVDASGLISGVHWRDRRDPRRRWVILAATARSVTLGHEIGHYLSLAHSIVADSVMNVEPTREPREALLRFTEPELARMRRAIRRMRDGGNL